MVDRMATARRVNKMKEVVKHRRTDIVVVLEDLHDPHNAQAIFRTCDAFGIQDVYLIFENQKPFDPKVIGQRSSSSAHKWLDFHIYSSTKTCFNELKKEGRTIIGTALSDESIPIVDASLDDATIALVFGNERDGLSDIAMELADELMIIPMKGMIQSLNISVSAAIAIFAAARRRGKELKEGYSQQEQDNLLRDFLER